MISSTKVPFRLYDTLSRSVRPFEPEERASVSIYTCGPTVYERAHLGNLRTYIFEDVLVRTLHRFGYGTRRVMNVTDVGHLVGDGDDGQDKLELGAAREGRTAWEVARRYEALFIRDSAVLNLLSPDRLVRATETVQEQIAFIGELEAKGYVYATSDGLYFDASKVPDYGKLARLDLAGQEAGARVGMGEKRHLQDFALWKLSDVPGMRHMEWPSPWGLGYPGWHIECSAIIRLALGDTVDIHCGGADHPPVHHSNEIAQSEAATGRPLARYWMHGEFLQVDGGKMGKSLGNGYTVADLEDRGIDPLSFKLFTYGAKYRSKLNFTWEGLRASAEQLAKLRAGASEAKHGADDPALHEYVAAFEAALANDLNLPVALSVLYAAVRGGMPRAAVRRLLELADQVLALDLTREEVVLQEPLASRIADLVQARATSRLHEDWAESDRIRAQLSTEGYAVTDGPSGQEVTLIDKTSEIG